MIIYRMINNLYRSHQKSLNITFLELGISMISLMFKRKKKRSKLHKKHFSRESNKSCSNRRMRSKHNKRSLKMPRKIPQLGNQMARVKLIKNTGTKRRMMKTILSTRFSLILRKLRRLLNFKIRINLLSLFNTERSFLIIMNLSLQSSQFSNLLLKPQFHKKNKQRKENARDILSKLWTIPAKENTNTIMNTV
jgi:hypothetical protein